MDDDFNTADGITVLFDLVKDINNNVNIDSSDELCEGALNLIKLNFKEGFPLLYYSNIIFYDNNNQTLPIGMDVSSSVLVDCKRFEFTLVRKNKFRTNNYFTESNNLILPKSKDVFVYEYDVDLKGNSKHEEDE